MRPAGRAGEQCLLMHEGRRGPDTSDFTELRRDGVRTGEARRACLEDDLFVERK